MIALKNKTASFRSLGDFKEIFTGISSASTTQKEARTLYANWIDSPLGSLIAIGDQKQLYLLEFVDWRKLPREILRLRKNTNAIILPGQTSPLTSIKKELKEYFAGKLKRFKTPLHPHGTDFQKDVWSELKKIPFGQCRSYYDIAMLIGKPTAYRAVANANGKNLFVIVIPCHRVINHNGGLGGYGAGLPRKEWLLTHEHNTQ